MIDEEKVTEVAEQEQDVEQPEQVVEQPKEDLAAKNLRALREKAERIERERDEALRRLQEIEAKQQPVEDEDALEADVYVEGKHLNKTAKKIKKLEQELKEYQQKNNEMLVETRLKTQYPDFDSVVTKDNIEALKTNHPELAHLVRPGQDLYSTAVSAYSLIKKLGIAQPTESYSEEKTVVQRNINKPRSISSVSAQEGSSPLSRANAFANGLSDDLKKQLWKEMEDSMRNG